MGVLKKSTMYRHSFYKQKKLICRITWEDIATFFLSLTSTAQNTIFFTKSYLLPLVVDERGNEPILIRKAHHFVSFKVGGVQLLDLLKFLGEATSRDFSLVTSPKSFLKACKISETKSFLLYEWFCKPEMNSHIAKNTLQKLLQLFICKICDGSLSQLLHNART